MKSSGLLFDPRSPAAFPLVACLALLAGGLPARAQQPGDLVVCFEVAKKDGTDVDIFAQRVSREGSLLWGDAKNAVAVVDSTDIQTAPAVCEDGEGGVIVVYEYKFQTGKDAGDTDIVAQHVAKDGKLLWEGPQPVASSKSAETRPVVVSDGQGGAIVVYEWTSATGDRDILAQRIDSAGKMLWNDGNKPAVISASDSVERNACVVPDGQGGVMVFFEWVGKDGDIDIMGEHVSADGRILWGTKQALDVANSGNIECHPVAVPDGAGGAIVVFESTPRTGEYQGDTDIMAQRVSPEGKLLWPKPAVVASAPGIERNPVAVSDGAGGVIVAFEYELVGGEHKGDIDVFAQRLDASGQMKWGEGKRSVIVGSSKDQERAPAIAPDGRGGAIVAFEVERRDGTDAGDFNISAQRLSDSGAMLWNEGKRSQPVGTSSWHEQRPLIRSDGLGGAIVVYTATAVGGNNVGDVDIEAARLDGDGKLLWREGKRAVDVAVTERLERNPCAVIIGGR